MATINVSTTAELQTALASAHGGDTILLAAGDYSAVNLQNYNFATPVTITSADAAHPATLTDLLVRNSSGLNFSHLEFDGSSNTADYSFQVNACSHINLSNLWVHGSLDGNPQDDLQTMMIRNSSYVTLSNSEFEQAYNALNQLDNDHLQITGNSFHDIRCDGIRGGGSSYVTVSGNSFTNFHNVAGDHSDAIQFWTTNTTTSAHDIAVTNNVITRGDGSAIQGVFFRDQVGTLPFVNVTISGNMLVGTLYNGIDVQGGRTVTISNNTVAGLADQKSWIRLDNVTGGTVDHNSAGTLMQNGVTNLNSNANVSVTDFQVLLPTADQADQLLHQWLSTNVPVAGIYDNEQMWMSSGTLGGTTTDTGTTTSTGTTSSGSSGTTSTGSTGTSTSGGDAGGTTVKGHGSTKGHQVMPKLEVTSETQPLKYAALGQTAETGTKAASTSSHMIGSAVDLSSDHLLSDLGFHAKPNVHLFVQHDLLPAAHVLPAAYQAQNAIVSTPAAHVQEWVHELFTLHEHSLI